MLKFSEEKQFKITKKLKLMIIINVKFHWGLFRSPSGSSISESENLVPILNSEQKTGKTFFSWKRYTGCR